MAGEANDIVAPRARLVRGALTGWAVFVYFFLFAPIVLLVIFRKSLEISGEVYGG